jgi:hypothetical protein
MLGLLFALMFVACLTGCASMCETLYPNQCGKTKPEITYVTDYEKPTKLPRPEVPESALECVDVDVDDWRVWLEAIAHDDLMTHDALDRCLFVIDSYNKAIDEMSEDSDD